MPNIKNLLRTISQVGQENSSAPRIDLLQPFDHFFHDNGTLSVEDLDKRDGCCTRRELLIRFLLLSAVLDQGPDIEGVRKLTLDVSNNLYSKEIRFLHTPLLFFKELNIAIDRILEEHESIKEVRSLEWARANKVKNPDRYNLFMDNTTQVLNYAIFRWGVPLALPLLLERDRASEENLNSVLFDHLASFCSAEIMSQEVKDHRRYGLGKAIGYKACHLFAKWTISSFNLLSRDLPNWGPYSYEVPFDSNAGRVLWRTGFFSQWAETDYYIKKNVVQPGQGKGGLNYIRVTNMRGLKAMNPPEDSIRDAYNDICVKYLCTHKRCPKKVEIQRIPHAILLKESNFGIAEFDDGLIHVGTKFCFNHESPKCEECPLRSVCKGANEDQTLINDYRT